MKYKLKSFAFILLCCTVWTFCTAQKADDKKRPIRNYESFNQLEVDRYQQIFSAILHGVSSLYVDTFDTKKIVSDGINQMLSDLDPYTVYIPESETKDFRFMTTGEYGGIGSYIQQRDSAVYVSNPMPGTPAEKAGLKMGDKFVKIDTSSVIPGTNYEVSNLLKGPIGTDVEVVIRRLGENKDRKVTLTREKVVVNQVVHKGIYGDGVGYIRLSGFTDKSAKNVLDAFEDLKASKKMKSLILDLRGNGGGVLEGAIEILGLFLPKKTMVLYTEGRQPGTSQKYYTPNKPMDTEIPIVVLINNGSASASEIVAGTLQDMDRAVLIGSKSFGKGLVQTTRPLPYDGVLKVTISRYHIPSGRCIQQLDYSHRNPDGSVAAVPDSLTNVFKTKNGREVRDGGGIRPDIEVEDETLPGIMYYLIREGALFAYSNKLFLEKPAAKSYSEVEVTDADLDGLVPFLKDTKFKYGEQSLKMLEGLQKLAEFEGYKESSKEGFELLKKELKPNLERDLKPHRTLLRSYLRSLLAAHYFGMDGQYAINLETDPTMVKALSILKDPVAYRSYLQPKEKKVAANEQEK